MLALNGVATGCMMRWGLVLVPYSGESAYPLINAIVEKLTTWYGRLQILPTGALQNLPTGTYRNSPQRHLSILRAQDPSTEAGSCERAASSPMVRHLGLADAGELLGL